MKKKIIIISLLATAAVFVILFIRYQKSNDDIPTNIIRPGQSIQIQDIKMFFKGFPAQSVNENPREYFTEEIANLYTVRFFKFIQTQIDYTNRNDHLAAVKAYLDSVFDPQKALEMFALYEKFLDYEIGIHEKAKSWGTPSSAAEFLRYLQAVQDYRRDIFGADVADAMWGAEVKAKEYTIRKQGILTDANLYGSEKEKRLAELKEDMWGADAARIEDPPRTDPEKYASYQEKQLIYQRDLQELPVSRRFDKIRDFRKEYFSPDQVARLEQVDAQLAAESKRDAGYYIEEKAILNDPAQNEEQKALAIRELQDNIFGEEADAFRRRLNIQRGIKQ